MYSNELNGIQDDSPSCKTDILGAITSTAIRHNWISTLCVLVTNFTMYFLFEYDNSLFSLLSPMVLAGVFLAWHVNSPSAPISTSKAIKLADSLLNELARKQCENQERIEIPAGSLMLIFFFRNQSHKR